jgi:hypothetical protein
MKKLNVISRASTNRDIAVGVQGAWDACYLLNTKIGYELVKGIKTSFAVSQALSG